MAKDFETIVTPMLAERLEPGEALRGVIAASFQKTFSGSMYAMGVTDRRLLLQPLDRKLEPKDPPQTVSDPAALASARLDGAGNGWVTAPMIIADATSLTLRITVDGGESIKLMMTRGGMKMLGGESQRTGVIALGELLAAARPS